MAWLFWERCLDWCRSAMLAMQARNLPCSMGLSRKAFTWSWIASFRTAISSEEVKKTTGIWASWVRTRLASSSPPILGMVRSVARMWMGPAGALKISQASWPSLASSTRCPAPISQALSRVRVTASSSTRRMVARKGLPVEEGNESPLDRKAEGRCSGGCPGGRSIRLLESIALAYYYL